MKRTLLRTWKILLLWLFACYEIGSLLDYLFFFFLNAAFWLLSWFTYILVYIIYDCILVSIKFVLLFFIKWFLFLLLLFFHLMVLASPLFFDIFINNWDILYTYLGKEAYFLYSTVLSSIKIVFYTNLY